MMSLDEEDTLERLKAYRRRLIDPSISEHRGRIVKTTGDGLLAEFSSAVDAVRCAVELQNGLAGLNAPVPPNRRIEFRIGINVGDVIADEGDLYGDGVMSRRGWRRWRSPVACSSRQRARLRAGQAAV